RARAASVPGRSRRPARRAGTTAHSAGAGTPRAPGGRGAAGRGCTLAARTGGLRGDRRPRAGDPPRPHDGRPGRRRTRALPLASWDTVPPISEARHVDPLLVVALIRQESLFEPTAVSAADAHGVMQLLPSTAREMSTVAGTGPPTRSSLHEVTTNVTLGVTL